jgi:hypothetical protein
MLKMALLIALVSLSDSPAYLPPQAFTEIKAFETRLREQVSFQAVKPPVSSHNPETIKTDASEESNEVQTGIPVNGGTQATVQSGAQGGNEPSWEKIQEARNRARDFAQSSQARIGFALQADDHQVLSWRGSSQYSSNSLIKAVIMTAYLRRGSVKGRSLTGSERQLLGSMIKESDNRAATILIRRTGTPALVSLGDKVGMRSFDPKLSTWGSSKMSPLDATRLMQNMFTHIPARHRQASRHWMSNTVNWQKWGLWEARPEGGRLYAKAGWSGRGRVVHAGQLRCNGQTINLAVFVESSNQAKSIELVERVARRLLMPWRVSGCEEK